MSERKLTDVKLAKLLIKGGFLSREEVDKCRAEQKARKQAGSPIELGALMVEMGVVRQKQIDRIAGAYEKKVRPFGEIAVASMLIQQEDLDAALAEQTMLLEKKNKRVRLGSLLVKRDLLKQHQVEKILEQQGKVILQCGQCSRSYNVKIGKETGKSCKKCGAPLSPAGTGEMVALDVDASVIVEAIAAPAAPAPPPPDATKNLFGDFKPTKPLGQDSTGHYFKAKRQADNKPVTLKVYTEELSADTEWTSKMVAAVKEVAAFDQPNLRKVYSMGTARHRAYVALEWVKGRSLRKVLKAHEQLPPGKALAIAGQVCKALIYLHGRGVVHGDVRPSNILIATDGRVVLGGVGLSSDPVENIVKLVSDTADAVPMYIAPEQAVEGREVDHRCDIYGLGCVLYHMVAGRPPIEGKSPYELLIRYSDDQIVPPTAYNEELPDAVSKLILKMIAPAADDRPQDLGKLLDKFTHPERILGGGAPGAPPPLRTARMERMLQSDVSLGGLAVVDESEGPSLLLKLAAAAVVIATVAFVYVQKGESEAQDRAAKAREEAYTELKAFFEKHRLDYARQLEVRDRCIEFPKKYPGLDKRRLGNVQTWAKQVRLARTRLETDYVLALRKDIDPLIAKRRFDDARAALDARWKTHSYEGWRLAWRDLELKVASEEERYFEATRLQAIKQADRKDFAAAMATYRAAQTHFAKDSDYHKKIDQALKQLAEDRTAAESDADRRKRLASLEARRAIVRKVEVHEDRRRYDLAINELRQSMGAARTVLLDEDKAALEAYGVTLEQQGVLFAHLLSLDLEAVDLRYRIGERSLRVVSRSPMVVRLREHSAPITWRDVRPEAICRWGLQTLDKAANARALRLGIGVFGVTHRRYAAALEALGGLDEPLAKPYAKVAVEQVSAAFDAAIDRAAEGKARASLLAALGVEHAFGARLRLLPPRCGKALYALIGKRYAEVAGRGTTLSFDTPADAKAVESVRKEPAHVDAGHGQGFLRLASCAVRTTADAPRGICLLFRPAAGDSQLELRQGTLTCKLDIKADRSLRVLIFAGAKNAQMRYTLEGDPAVWHLLELRVDAKGMRVSIDGRQLDDEAFAVPDLKAPVKFAVRGDAHVDIDRLHIIE